MEARSAAPPMAPRKGQRNGCQNREYNGTRSAKGRKMVTQPAKKRRAERTRTARQIKGNSSRCLKISRKGAVMKKTKFTESQLAKLTRRLQIIRGRRGGRGSSEFAVGERSAHGGLTLLSYEGEKRFFAEESRRHLG